MKKIIFLSVFALLSAFATLESCKKTEAVDASSHSPQEQFFDGDEYDKGLVVEEPEEAEEPEEPDYQSDAVTKIIRAYWDNDSSVLRTKEHCNTYKYDNSFFVFDDNRFGVTVSLKLSNKEDIVSVESAKPIIKIEGGNNGIYYFFNNSTFQFDSTILQFNVLTDSISTLKTATSKITLTTRSGKKISKSLKFVRASTQALLNENYIITGYGNSKWSAYTERKTIGKTSKIDYDAAQTIGNSYVPQIGDAIFFGNSTRIGVIVTTPTLKAATRTKPASYKFKFVEMNSRCNNRKYTRSFKMTNPLQILSTDGVTYATKYFRD